MAENYERVYSPDGLRQKLGAEARTIGENLVRKALELHYAAQSPATPFWAKSAVYGALGYLITPIDAIPDFTPLLGYTDDLGVITAALATVAAYVTPAVKAQADRKLRRWFNK